MARVTQNAIKAFRIQIAAEEKAHYKSLFEGAAVYVDHGAFRQEAFVVDIPKWRNGQAIITVKLTEDYRYSDKVRSKMYAKGKLVNYGSQHCWHGIDDKKW